MRAALALMLLAAPAAAQEVDCSAPQFQVEMTYCAEQAWLRADAALNDAWGAARDHAKAVDGALPKPQQGVWQALLDGQRAWIVFRDKTCEAEGAEMRGGTGEPMLIYACRERLTWERVEGLNAYARGL
jgi:uncharacterized protein YecT (DUF1311 family)